MSCSCNIDSHSFDNFLVQFLNIVKIKLAVVRAFINACSGSMPFDDDFKRNDDEGQFHFSHLKYSWQYLRASSVLIWSFAGILMSEVVYLKNLVS